MYKYIKIALISLGVLVFLVFILYYTGILGYMAMNVDNYDYNPPLKHEDYTDYKLKIPYELVPLIPNKIGLKQSSYSQLYNDDSIYTVNEYEKLSYFSIFKKNDFDYVVFDKDDQDYIISMYVYKQFNIFDSLNVNQKINGIFQILNQHYHVQYQIYRYKYKQIYYINWEDKDYIVSLNLSKYYEKEKNSENFYLISFSKKNQHLSSSNDTSFEKLNDNYIKNLGIDLNSQ